MIYFLIVLSPVFAAFLSDHTKGSLSYVLFIVALLIPCIFAGARDETVGTDVMTYAYWTFYSAQDTSFHSFLTAYSGISAIGFNVISWLFAQCGSFPLYLGVLEALVIFPICLYAKRLFPNSSWVAVAIYMLMLFPISLNIMKQMIAVAICVPAIEFIFRNKKLPFCLAVITATFLFHQTAAVAFIYWPAVKAILSIGSEKAFYGKAQGLALIAIASALFLAAFLLGDRVVSILSALKDSYSFQANASGTRLNYSSLILAFGMIAVYTLEYAHLSNSDSKNTHGIVFVVFSLIGTFAVQFNIVGDSLMRFSYYGLSFFPLCVAALLGSSHGRRESLSVAFLTTLCIAYFVQAFVINGGNQIYPYTSSILGI